MGRLRLLSTCLSRIHKTLNPNLKPPNPGRRFAAAAEQATASSSTPPSPSPSPPPASDKVASIVEDMSELTLLEMSDLTEVLRSKLGVKEMPIMAVMMPGMGFSSGLRGAGGKGGAAAAAGTGKEEKAEKTVFDLKLDGFEAAGKIKVIKEVRGFTDLGLKEAKDLVEKAPTLLKKGVSKEEAEKIIAKMKEIGAKVSME